jgi:uncharacterized membrane protein HdeD (DUF308 family)
MQTPKLPNWVRALAIVGGILALVAGLLILVFPGLGILAVVYMLAFALIVIGAERLSVGITGHIF